MTKIYFFLFINAQTSTSWLEQDPFRGERLELNEIESKFWKELIKT